MCDLSFLIQHISIIRNELQILLEVDHIIDSQAFQMKKRIICKAMFTKLILY